MTAGDKQQRIIVYHYSVLIIKHLKQYPHVNKEAVTLLHAF